MFLCFFGLFVLVFTAFCVVLAVPMVRFSSFCFSHFSFFFGGGFGGVLGGGDNVLSRAFYLTPFC